MIAQFLFYRISYSIPFICKRFLAEVGATAPPIWGNLVSVKVVEKTIEHILVLLQTLTYYQDYYGLYSDEKSFCPKYLLIWTKGYKFLPEIQFLEPKRPLHLKVVEMPVVHSRMAMLQRASRFQRCTEHAGNGGE